MRNIIITGASRGLGFETARIFAKDRQNRVFAIARNEVGLRKLLQTCRSDNGSDNLIIFPFDLEKGDYENVLIPAILDKMDKIDVLVNNAGLLINKPFEMMEVEDFDRIFTANVRSAFSLVKGLYFNFAANSHILNIGSMGGFQGSAKFPGLSLYSASKGALAVLTECMAEEFRERNIKANCLALGSAQTEMLNEAFPGYRAPLSASEMAVFIADFAIRGQSWFNGKIIPVSATVP